MNEHTGQRIIRLDRWDIGLAAFTVVLAVSLPLEQMAYHADYQHPLLWLIRWAGYVLFAMDGFRRRGEGGTGRYLNLLAALPLGPALLWMAPGWPDWVHVAAHLLPMLRLVRVYVVARTWQEMNPAQTGLRRIATTVLFITLMLHWVGCWQIAVYDAHTENASITLRYLQALYWSVTTMTTIGYGDITPDLERPSALLFSMFIMALGAGAFGFIIGNIATIMANLDFARNQHLDRMQKINAFLRYHNIPARLRDQVHDYFGYVWRTRRGFNEAEILAEMPAPVRREVEYHLRSDIVTKVPFFKGADENMVRALVARLTPRVAIPGEKIIRRGEIGEAMYFIAAGNVEVLGPDGHTVATLADGSFFGEIALLERAPRTADVRATTYCDLYTLEKSSLDDVIGQYPEFGLHIRTMAARRQGKPAEGR